MDDKLQSLLYALNAEYKDLARTKDAVLTEETLQEWNASHNVIGQSEVLLAPPVDDDEYSLASTLSSSDHDSDDGGYADQMLSIAVENARVNKMMLSELSNQTHSFPAHSNASIQSTSLHGSIDKYSTSNRSVTFAESLDIVEFQQYSDVNYQRYEGFAIEESNHSMNSRSNNTKHVSIENKKSASNHQTKVQTEHTTKKATTKSNITARISKHAEPTTKAPSFKDSLDLYIAVSREANKPKKKYANPHHVLKISTLKPTTFAPTNNKIKPPILGTRKDLNILPLDAQLSTLIKEARVKVMEAPAHIRMSMTCTSCRSNTTFPSLKSVTYSKSENFISADTYNAVAKSEEDFARYLENNLFHSSFNSHKASPTHVQYSNFSRKYALDFVYLVFDVQMQLLGTYDINSGSHFPGIQLAPEYLNKFRMKQKSDSTQAQVIDINTALLPPSTFAVVPLILDASVVYSDEMDFQVDVFSKSASGREPPAHDELDAKNMQQMLHQQYIEALADGAQGHWLMKRHLTSISQLTELAEAENTEALREVLNTRYATSSHLTSCVMEHLQQTRLSRTAVALGNGHLDSYSTPSNDGNNGSPLSKSGSFIPFILFRSAGDATHAKWLLQPAQISVSTKALDGVSNLVLKYLHAHHMLPYTTVHVEHCVNCEQHQLTTRHVIDSYNNKFDELQSHLQSQLLPVHAYANTKTCLSFSKTPRVGAFEVTMQPYTATRADLVYSKIRNKVFPTIKAIAEILSPFAIPRFTVYPADRLPTMCVRVYDAYYKQPIENALVQIHQIYSYFKPNLDAKVPMKASNEASLSVDYALVRTWARDDVVRWFRAYEVPENDIIVALNAGVTTGPALMTLVTPSSLRSWGIKSLLQVQKLMMSIEKMKSSKVDSANSEDVGRGASTPGDLAGMLYCQEIKQSESCHSSRLPPKSNMRYDSNDFDCRSIDQGYTDDNGAVTRTLATSGAYLLKIQSPFTSEYSSHIVTYSTNESKVVCVTLQPLLALVRFSMQVTRENTAYQRLRYLDNGVLVTVVNILTLRRHNVLLRPTSGPFLSPAASSEDGEEQDALPTCDYIQGDAFLPLGKYFSLVDGSVFSVFSPYKVAKSGMPSGANNYVDVAEKAALRCHQRQVLMSIRIFQRMIRRKVQRSTARKMYTFFLIRIRIGRRIAQARARIRHRKAAVIQAAVRRSMVYRRYKLIIRFPPPFPPFPTSFHSLTPIFS